MIQYTYSKQLTSLDKPLRDSDIVCTGVEDVAGMVDPAFSQPVRGS